MNAGHLAALQAIFTNPTGRVLVEYYTNPRSGEEWVIPDIAAILGVSGVYPSPLWSPEIS